MGRASSKKRDSSRGVDPEAVLVRFALDGAFLGKGWQGPTLTGSLRGVSATQALWRPGKGRKSIWEQALHAAYWKWTIARILAVAAHGVEHAESKFSTFPRSPSNWPALPERCDEPAWKRDRALLASVHRILIEQASAIPARRMLDRPSPKHKYAIGFYIAGAAAHDAYHTGQIQLLKRLAPARAARPAPSKGRA